MWNIAHYKERNFSLQLKVHNWFDLIFSQFSIDIISKIITVHETLFTVVRSSRQSQHDFLELCEKDPLSFLTTKGLLSTEPACIRKLSDHPHAETYELAFLKLIERLSLLLGIVVNEDLCQKLLAVLEKWILMDWPYVRSYSCKVHLFYEKATHYILLFWRIVLFEIVT